jgi:gluconolactonase
MTQTFKSTRRNFLQTTSATAVMSLTSTAFAQSFEFKPNQRYPDPSVLILDPSFGKYRIYSSTVEQVGTGMRWAEGPVYFPNEVAGQPGYLLVSDIPNNRLMKFDEASNKFTVHKENVNYANGNTRDRQGRLFTCEHSVVVKSDDSVWFTDPLFGINGEWEGARAKSEQATTNVYRITKDGKMTAVITDLLNPNGLAFSPDEKKLYVVEWRGTPNRSIWSYDVNGDGTVGGKIKLIDADGPGSLDGFRVDRDGNLWCGWGYNGAFSPTPTDVGGGMKAHLPIVNPADMDGVKVFNAQGKAIGFIRLPERCGNLEFGGPKRNRLYMASSHSLYALYVESHGAV